MRIDAYRILGWVAPILCIIAAGVVLNNSRQALADQQEKQKAAQNKLIEVRTSQAELEQGPLEQRFAAKPEEAGEETTFLASLRLRASLDHVSIQQWTSKSGRYAAGDTEEESNKNTDEFTPIPVIQANKDDAAALKGVVRIDCAMKVSGAYGDLRRFMGDLTRSRRLFNTREVHWSRDQVTGQTLLDMTLSRYILVSSDHKKDVDQKLPGG